jgi:hypothetical protein
VSDDAALATNAATYILTFNTVADFEDQYGLTSGTLPGKVLTLTYPGGSDLPYQSIDLSGPSTSSARVARVIVPPTSIVAATFTATTVAIDAFDFEAAGVVVGDVLVLVANNGVADEPSFLTVAAVSTVTLTFIATGLIAGDEPDYEAGGAYYVFSEVATNAIIIQQGTTPVVLVDILDQTSTAYTAATAVGFGSDILGGNYIIWDTLLTAPDPVMYTLPNPDSIPGLVLQTGSTEVTVDNATLITCAGIGRIQGEITYVPPNRAVTGEWEDLLLEDVTLVGAYDTFEHDTINFEALGILPGDTIYIEFDTGTSPITYYTISEVDNKKLVVDGHVPETPNYSAVFAGILNNVAVPVPYAVATTFKTEIVGGVVHVYRGDLKAIVIYPAGKIIDSDNADLISFRPNGSVTPGEKGFLNTHINLEEGDLVYVTDDLTPDLNTYFSPHRIQRVEVDRLILSSLVYGNAGVPPAPRSTAIEQKVVNENVLFYTVKKSVQDVLWPLNSYIVDNDPAPGILTFNSGSAMVDPRPLGGVFPSSIDPGVGTYIVIDDDGVISEPTIKGHVVDGTIYGGYTALRTDLTSQLVEVFNTNEILGKLGKVRKENPVALAASIALANSVTVGVKVYCIEDDRGGSFERVAYQQALDFLTNTQSVYGLVPLTRTNAVLGSFKQHVEAMSMPEKAGWRIVFINSELPTEKLILDRHGEVSSLDTNVTIKHVGVDTADVRRFQDTEASFISDGVATGMKLKLFYGVEDFSVPAVSFTIDTVNSENLLTVTELITDENGDVYVSPTNVGLFNYEIIRELSKSEQATEIKLISESYNSRRVYHMWPDTIEIDGDEVPGYYLGAAVAGMVAGIPAHQGFTKYGIAGINKVVHVREYFNEVQLDVIASGGTYIVQQDTPQGLPYSRHQLSTDRQFIETQELSITKNFDFMSYFFYDLLTPFIGIWNVYDETIKEINRVLTSGIAFQQTRNFPRIGPALRSGTKVRTVEQASFDSSRIEVYLDLNLPRPLNTIGLHLVLI